MQCTSNTCKHFERFNFRSQASTVAWRGWRIAHLALPYLFTFTASPESHRLMYGSVPDCQWNQWPVSNISLSEMASARASAQLWWWWWWVISLVSPLVSSLVGGAVYTNVIWPGMKWKYASGRVWAVGVWKVLTVIRMLNVDQKYRKCESKYEKVCYINLV